MARYRASWSDRLERRPRTELERVIRELSVPKHNPIPRAQRRAEERELRKRSS